MRILVAISLVLGLSACQPEIDAPIEPSTEAGSELTQEAVTPSPQDDIPSPEMEAAVADADQALSVDGMVGDYATEDYAMRAEGYDWVGVSIEKIDERSAYIKVRARGDKKRPTCTFDGVGFLKEDGVLEVDAQGRPLHFTVDGATLTVSTPSPDDESLLSFYCSGGVTLAGPYQKLDEPLDASQLAEEAFHEELSLQGITFSITASDGPLATVVIRPSGLEIDNRMVVHQVDGRVAGAEIEDMNADGWPEALVYAQSDGSGSYGSVLAYSVNNGKSMSQVYLPDLEGEAAEGYMGHDQFSLVETSLGRQFPVYEEGDPNAAPSGPMRQIEYKLVDGEAGRHFEIANVTDIPAQ